MRNAEARRNDQEEVPAESGERRTMPPKGGMEQEKSQSQGDRFEQDADRYIDIRDNISDKKSELNNLRLNELTKKDKVAADRLNKEIETLEEQAEAVEKGYGGQANQFTADARRQKNIKTEMDLATRKMDTIARVMKRGEFPGGEDAANAEMDAQAQRISGANRELKALKGLYDGPPETVRERVVKKKEKTKPVETMMEKENRVVEAEVPAESGEREIDQTEAGPEAGKEMEKAQITGDRFSSDADLYNAFRAVINERRTERTNLSPQERDSAKRLNDEIDMLERRTTAIEKGYGDHAKKFTADAQRQKEINTEMDEATRKMGSVDGALKRGEFPGGETAAHAEMDMQAARIAEANRELNDIKNTYDEVKNGPRTLRGLNSAMEVRQNNKERFDEAPTLEIADDEEIEVTDDEIEVADDEIEVTDDMIEDEPVPLLTKEQKAKTVENEKHRQMQQNAEDARAVAKSLENRLRNEHGIGDPEAELAKRATGGGLMRAFGRLFSRKNREADAILAEYDKASKHLSELDAELNQEANRGTDRYNEAMAMRGSKGTRLSSGESRNVEKK